MASACERLPDLRQTLTALIAQIPPGRVTTCGALAEALGNPIAARWIGHFLLHHPHGSGCACHRVVRAGGRLGPYIGGSIEAKARRLAAEGVEVVAGQVDLARLEHRRLHCDRPLEQLRARQERIARRVEAYPRRRVGRLVAGVDVAYAAADEAQGAYALCEVATGRLVWAATVRVPIVFPYITSYLTFRELPVLLALVEAARRAGRLSGVVLVDGTGVLHPRRAGIAAHLGVEAAVATVGVTKKRLCGSVDARGMAPGESRPVLIEGRPLGVALRPTGGSARPLFISPGHRTDLAFAERLVRCLLHGRRLPAPLYWADRLSRAALRAGRATPIDGTTGRVEPPDAEVGIP